MRKRTIFLVSLAVVAASACSVDPAASNERTARAAQAIAGGTKDADDPAVVLILILNKTQTDGSLCSGTIVSPHVIATAAHCVAPSVLEPQLGTGYTFQIFTAPDNNDPAQSAVQSNYVLGATAVFDPAFDPASMTAHDVGALVTKKPLPMAPVAINRTALGPEWVGAPARVVGYGLTKANDPVGGGTKYQGATTIAALDGDSLTIGTDGPHPCMGDSGGPTLITRNGVESIAGVHSSTSSATCAGDTRDMRADVYLAPFLDPVIAENDPGFVPPGDGSDAGAGGDGGAGGSGATSTSSGTDTDAGSGCSVSDVGDPAGSGALAVLGFVSALRWRRRHARARASATTT